MQETFWKTAARADKTIMKRVITISVALVLSLRIACFGAVLGDAPAG